MPANYTNAIKNARCQVTVNALDAVGAGGSLVIGTSALAGGAGGVLATIPLAKPSFSIVNGLMTALGVPLRVDATGTGNAAKAELRDGAGLLIMDGLTVGLVGAAPDVVINAINISTGQTIQATLGTIQHN